MSRNCTIEQAEQGFCDDTCFDADYQKKEYLEDFYAPEIVSNCCSAKVENGRCMDCKEMCEEVYCE